MWMISFIPMLLVNFGAFESQDIRVLLLGLAFISSLRTATATHSWRSLCYITFESDEDKVAALDSEGAHNF